MFCKLERTFVYHFFAFIAQISAIFAIFWITFLLYQQIKSNKEYTTIYWSLITIGYTVTTIHSIAALFRDIFYCYSEIFNLILGTIEWYFLFFLSFWNFILGLYRCTALGFSLKHDLIWSNKKLFAIISNLLFPFPVNGYNIFGKNCATYGLTEICKFELGSILLWAFIINSAFSFLTLFFVFFVIFKTKNISNYHAKVERQFIIQTILSTIFQTIFYFFYWFRTACVSCDKGTLIGLALVFYVFIHYANMIIFLIVSPAFRRNFFQFYRIPLGKFLKIETQTIVLVPTISTY